MTADIRLAEIRGRLKRGDYGPDSQTYADIDYLLALAARLATVPDLMDAQLRAERAAVRRAL